MKIAFIGGGNMAQAIMGGLLAQGHAPGSVTVVEPNASAQSTWTAWGAHVKAGVDERILKADIIIVAVKPQMLSVALAPLTGKLRGQLVISIVAGARIATFEQLLGVQADGSPSAAIVRTMPNTPALISAGISALFAGSGVTATQREQAQSLLGSVGITVWVEQEDLLDAVTAVSGSGPAYVFYFMEALEAAAQACGLPESIGKHLARETFLGATRLANSRPEPLAVLRANVTSPNGTTERAIRHFDESLLKSTIVAAVQAAHHRAIELGNELDQTVAVQTRGAEP